MLIWTDDTSLPIIDDAASLSNFLPRTETFPSARRSMVVIFWTSVRANSRLVLTKYQFLPGCPVAWNVKFYISDLEPVRHVKCTYRYCRESSPLNTELAKAVNLFWSKNLQVQCICVAQNGSSHTPRRVSGDAPAGVVRDTSQKHLSLRGNAI